MGVMERGGCSQECPLQQERQAKFQEHHKYGGGGGADAGMGMYTRIHTAESVSLYKCLNRT